MKRMTLCLFAILLVSCESTERSDSELDARISRIENGLIENLQIKGLSQGPFNINERLEELGIPGLSVVFAVDGEVEWARAYGLADASSNRQMTTETYLLAGSISKPVAAVRSLQLAENGVFHLDENINKYLTSWQVPDNEFTQTEKVTLRRILNHTAGLTVWGFPGYDKGDEIPSVVEVLDGKGNTDPVRVFRQPGEAWQYSGGGYTIMQLAIVDTERSTFPQILKENVLDRLGMVASTFENPLPDALHEKAATGYRANGDEVESKWPIHPEMAAAGLWTTPSELVQYALEIQDVLQSGQDGILSYQTVLQMLDAESGTYGLGPSVEDHMFGHAGANVGFQAQIYAWKDLPYAVVVMVNSEKREIIRELLLSIATEYELPGIEPVVRRVADVTPDDLERFAGRYDIGKVGIIKLTVDGERLKLSHEGSDFVAWWYPQTDLEFFGSVSGSIRTFEVQGDTVIGFTSERFDGVRLNEGNTAE